MDTPTREDLERLFTEGVLVEWEPFPMARLVEGGAREPAGLTIPGGLQYLLDPANWDRTVIVLVDPKTMRRSTFATRDASLIDRAKQQYLSRFETVGVWVRACCEMRGGASPEAPLFHVDRFVPPLSGYRGWEFKLDDQPGRFIVQRKLDTIDELAKVQALDELDAAVNSLAVAVGRGIRIWHLAVSPIPKGWPAVSYGVAEEMVSEPSDAERRRAEALAVDPQRSEVIRALNQSYCEYSKRAKLGILWAACEHLLKGEPKRLLSDESVGHVVDSLRVCDEFAKDEAALSKAQMLLTDWLKTLGRNTRNDRISGAIADLLGMETTKAGTMLRQAFQQRGTFGHSLSDEADPSVDESIAFFQATLLRLLDHPGPGGGC